MLQRDYFLRLIREFAEALELMLNKKNAEQQREEVKELYRQYVGPYEFYHTATIDEVMQSMEQFPEDERTDRLEMLAELCYAEASLLTGPTRQMLEEKAYMLFDFVNTHSATFSIARQQKLALLKQAIDKASKR